MAFALCGQPFSPIFHSCTACGGTLANKPCTCNGFSSLLSLASGGSGYKQPFHIRCFIFIFDASQTLNAQSCRIAVIFCKFSAVWCNGKGCKPVPLIALRNVLNISLGSCNALGVSLLFHRCLYFCIDRGGFLALTLCLAWPLPLCHYTHPHRPRQYFSTNFHFIISTQSRLHPKVLPVI